MTTYANGKLPGSVLTQLPTSWSNQDRIEYLRSDAAASLSRALSRAVADSGENFQVYDAYRSFEEQEAMLRQNYTRTSKTGKARSSDRIYQGVRWEKKSGAPNTATPGLSNHGEGTAADIHPSGIQSWFKDRGPEYGWSWDEGRDNGEDWHYVYEPEHDQHTAEGYLDHAWVQEVVGAEVDGKIGTGTVALIKAWQTAHGLDADGKVGPATKAAMLGESVADDIAAIIPDDITDPAEPISGIPSTSEGYEYTYIRSDWDTQGIGAKVHSFETTVEGIYLHYPGSGDVVMADETPTQIGSRLRGYRKTHVETNGWNDIGYNAAADQQGRTYELRGLGNESGANGGSTSNNHGIAILCMVGNDEQPTQALIDAVNGLIAQVTAKRDSVEWIKGHQQSPDASTDCPGEPIMGLLAQGGVFVLDGVPGASQGPDIIPPSTLVAEDGRAGTETIGELQRRLGVDDDGRAAEKTWTPLQEFLDAPYKDGQISRQSYRPEELGNGIVDRESAWECTGPGSDGSQTIELMQAYIGAEVDGVWGPATSLRLQQFMNDFPAGFTTADREIARQRAEKAGL